MDTLNNDFQVKLLFGSKGSEDHIMHLMGCDTYLSVITFFFLFMSLSISWSLFLHTLKMLLAFKNS